MSADDRSLVPFGEVRPRALVVDDEVAARDLFARVLGRAGIDTLVASDGKRALEILEHDSIHVLILDRHMPGLDGLEVIERLRAEPSTAHLPVILVTSDTDLTDRVYGLEHGADDYLTKPVELDELVARVRAQLRRLSPDDSIRQFVESANDAFVSWDAAGAITEWTAQAEALFGWSRNEVMGESFGTTILAPRHRIVHALRTERFIRDGERPLLGKWFELAALRRDTREIPIEMTMWLVSDHDHHTFNAFIRDLAKRNEIENALRERARLQTVVDGVSDVIILTDLVGVIVYTSPSARNTFGYEPDELYGHVLDEFVHADDQQAFGRTLDRAVKCGSDLVKAQRIRTRDGRYVWMEAATGVVRDTSGEVTGLEIVARDITSRKLADEVRKRATGDLAQMIKDLRADVSREQETVEELRARDRIKIDLVSTVSNELRSPLISISAHIDALTDPTARALSNRQRSMLGTVDARINTLLMMIENLSTIGGIEVGAFDVDPSPLDLRPAVRAAVHAILPAAREQGVAIELDLAADTGLVLADALQLDRVLVNVLANAIRFSPDGGTTTVSTKRSNTHVAIVVSDTGIGVPTDEQAKLFVPFYRSTIAIERGLAGTGLGLVIAKSIVDRHGGSIEVRSTPGEGTVIAFTLPSAPRAA